MRSRRPFLVVHLAVLALGQVACVTTAAPRSRLRTAGSFSVATGYELGAGPVIATAVPRSSREPVRLEGRSPGLLLGGESANFALVVPARLSGRLQPSEDCDLGFEAGWIRGGIDGRCALPGTGRWLALSLGVRGSPPLGRLPASYEARAALDLARPTTARWVPLLNLGVGVGRQVYATEAQMPGGSVFDVYQLSFQRNELRLEPMLGVEVELAPAWMMTIALAGHVVLGHGDANSIGASTSGELALAPGPVTAEHTWGLALTVMIGRKGLR